MNAPLIREAALDVVNTGEMVRRMARATFTVWRVLDSGKAQPMQMLGFEALIDIERAIAIDVHHGWTILIRETGTITGRTVIHTYRIRRGKWTGRYADARKSYPHVADRLFSVEVTAFQPVEPWRCVAGADRLGLTNILEARRG